MIFSLTACGDSDEEHTVVMTQETISNGTPVKDTVTMIAIGDSIQTERHTTEYDLSGADFDDEQRALLLEGVTDLYNSLYGGTDAAIIEDIHYVGTTLIATVVFDFSGDINELKEAGLLETELFSDNATYVSLLKTQQSFEMQGYRVVTE